MNYFITAIDTDSGKTFVSAILCEALEADYWKPVQCGMPRDIDTVRQLVSHDGISFFQETYLLKLPASPHAAAKADGQQISLEHFLLPSTRNDLVIEGAGGCLVPLNDHDFVIDLVPLFEATIILVADLYLGSINHTLLTIEALKRRDLPVKGIIFNGEPNPQSESIILKHAKLPCLLNIPRENQITTETVKKYATLLKENWYA